MRWSALTNFWAQGGEADFAKRLVTGIFHGTFRSKHNFRTISDRECGYCTVEAICHFESLPAPGTLAMLRCLKTGIDWQGLEARTSFCTLNPCHHKRASHAVHTINFELQYTTMSNSSKSFRSSSVSSLSLTTPPRVEVVEIDESPHPNRSRSRSRSLSTPLIHRPKARRETVVIHREPAHSNSSNSDPGEPQTFELTRWMEMKLDWNIKDYRNVLASLFTWLLLAGFIVLPGTFASIRNSQALNRIGKAGKIVVQAVQNLPLLWVAGILCLGGACGISWLWWENYDNYIWLVDRIFL